MSTPHDTPPKPPTAHADKRDRRASRLAGAVLLVFMLVAMLSNLWWARDNTVLPEDRSFSRLMEGGVTHDVAERLRDMPFSSQAATLQREAGWLALGDLGDRVRPGCPGWLFLADELQVHPDGESNALARVRSVVQTQQALAQRGVQLLVAVVPDKSRIAAAQACGVHRPAEFEGRITRWLERLEQQGVRVLDLSGPLAALGSDAYLRSDSHWSEAGAGAAAAAIAEQVRRTGVELLPERRYSVSVQDPKARDGDLVKLAGVQGLPQAWQPATDIISTHRYTPIAEQADDADALFGDAGTPTLALLGTSFSRTSAFAHQLARDLGVEIGNFARDGAKFGGSAQAYFKSSAWTDTPPRLIIWEVNERDLHAPLAPDDQIWP